MAASSKSTFSAVLGVSFWRHYWEVTSISQVSRSPSPAPSSPLLGLPILPIKAKNPMPAGSSSPPTLIVLQAAFPALLPSHSHCSNLGGCPPGLLKKPPVATFPPCHQFLPCQESVGQGPCPKGVIWPQSLSSSLPKPPPYSPRHLCCSLAFD